MMLRTAWLCLLNLLSAIFLVTAISNLDDSDSAIYQNEFAVHIPKGETAASEIASKYGYENIGQIGTLENYYLFRHHRIRKRSLDPSHEHCSSLGEDPEVIWVEQQVVKKRVKRDFMDYPHDFQPLPEAIQPVSQPLSDRQLLPLRKSREPQFFRNPFSGNTFGRAFSLFGPPRQNSPTQPNGRRSFPDPLYKDQWYMSGGAVGGFDMNISAAWALGYTGKGVVISILDDGIQHNHPDLKQNYDPRASTDINGNDADPMPVNNGNNKHGTRCAGGVASVAFNQYCGVGVAYNSSVGGVRMLDGTVNDAVEATAISLNPDHIDIYSASWGPEDDGKTVDGPGPLAKRAFINGVIRGRHGKGSIFIWASGNGGRHTDNCNCDGYTNSIFTLSISSASQRGLKPWYLEECSSTLATTYSSGTPGIDRSIATADMDGFLRPDKMCTLEHTGTSASAPLAAGVCALALEANPDLTWRDMQHLVVRTSRVGPLAKEEGWFQNGVGRAVSHKFGYGMMDGGAMVALAEKWTSVPPQHVCQTVIDHAALTIPSNRGESVVTEITTDGCQGTTGQVRYLEHVQAVISLRFLPRGNINIKLKSPSGTISTLLSERPTDVLSEKFDNWPFLSVHFWGEQSEGTWQLIVTNAGARTPHHPGVLLQWQLILHGTHENPERLRFSSRLNSFTPFNGFGEQLFSGSINKETVVKLGDTNLLLKLGDLQNISSKSAGAKSNLVNSEKYEKCHSECSGGCSGPGPENCKACKHFSIQNECVSVCPSGTFDSEDRSCLPCHGSCSECVGPRQNQCEVCPEHVNFIQHLGMCVEQCPLGYYAVDGECSPCGSECSKCSNSSVCLGCDHNLILDEGVCRLFCPIGYYESSTSSCLKCSAACKTCIGSKSNECASCNPDSILSRGRCVKKCPRGTAIDLDSKECQVCPMGCMECKSSEMCTSCLEGWRIKSGVCVAYRPRNCGINEYYHMGRCRPCHVSCLNCIGPRETQCLHCQQPSVLFIAKCIQSCPQGHFTDMGRCLPCPHGCAQCTSYSNCTSCVNKFVLQDGTCQTTCNEGFYSDRLKCAPCHNSCRTCFGPRRNQCFECPEGDLKVGSACQESCNDGYFLQDRECRKCYHYCRTCNGSGLHSCESCYDSLTLSDGLCMECSSGKYFDPVMDRCQACDDTCLTCTHATNTSCTSCQRPLSLHIESRSCRKCCETNNLESLGECCICDVNTGECLGSSSTDKRRIALSLPSTQVRYLPQNSWFASSTAVVLAACLVIIVLGSAIGMASKQNPSRHISGGGSFTYRRLGNNSSRGDSVPLLRQTNEHEEHSDEEDEVVFPGSDGEVRSHDAAATYHYIGRNSMDSFQDEFEPLFKNT